MKIKYFLFVSILAVAVFGFTNSAKASCMDSNFSQRTNAEQVQCLTAIIADLQSQLQTLLAQQGGQTWCHNFNTNLGFTNSGSGEVSFLHTALQRENFSYGSDNANEFAEDTGAAVVQFQAKYGIRQTGYVGPLTRGKLNSLYGCGITPPTIPNTPTVSFTANGSTDSTITVQVGSDTNFVYSSTNATNCYVYANSVLMNNVRGTDANGVEDINLTQGATSGRWQTLARIAGFTATYRVTCSNASGQQASKSITLNSISTPIQPTITVTSPNGGTYKQGDTINIQWQLTGTPWASDKIYVTIQNFGGSTGDGSIPAITASSGTGTYNYTVPSTLLPGAMYKVAVSGVVNGVAVSGSTSNYFSIASLSPSISPITVTSPNGGEQWLQGSTQTITWTGGNYSSGGYPGFDISLYPQPTSTCDIGCVRSGVQRVATNFVTATGAYTWQVSNNITPGNYLVEICAGGNGNLSAELACDDAGGINNNQYITVVAPIIPTVSFTANGSTDSTITVQVGSDTNFVYSSTNATNCYAYVNSSLMNSTPPDFNQGATLGHWETLARFPNITATYMVTCSSASGQQASKTITLSSIQ